MSWLIATAQAQAAAPAAAPANPLFSMWPMLLIFAVFYFMLIRPQNKRAKEHRTMLAAIEVGSEVATSGGIIGKVTEVSEDFLSVEIASNVQVKVQRNTIATVLPKGTVKNS